MACLSNEILKNSYNIATYYFSGRGLIVNVCSVLMDSYQGHSKAFTAGQARFTLKTM